jgi:hypothetical protein
VQADHKKEPILGEIIEASTLRFVAQCPQERLHEPPVYGAFVKVLPPGTPLLGTTTSVAPPFADSSVDPFADPPAVAPMALPADTPDGALYALVYAAATGSAEPGRRPAAYGLAEKELRAEQPQIFDLLATHFEALPVGYAHQGRVRANLPPRPPRLHAFVYSCSHAEVCALTDTPDFARRLLSMPGLANPDELLATCLRESYLCRDNDFAFLVRIGQQLANLLRDNPERLTALLRSLEP